MRTRLQGAMATMMLIVGSLLVVAAPAAAGEVPADEPPGAIEPDQAAEPDAEGPSEESADTGPETSTRGEDEPPPAEETSSAEPAEDTTGETDDADRGEDGTGDQAPLAEGVTDDSAGDESSDEDTNPAPQESPEPADTTTSDSPDADAGDDDNADDGADGDAEDEVVTLAEVLTDVLDDVDVCVSDGLDWTLVTTDAENGQWLVDNEGAQWPGNDGCLVRVCRVSVGTTFPAWYTDYATPSDVAWILQQNESAFVPKQGAQCPANEPVTICRLKGLDYNKVQVDPLDANWMIANNDAMLPGESGCLVRVCRLKAGEFFTFWHSVHATPEDAQWILSQSPSSYLAKPGQPCPGNEPVTICQLLGIDYKAQQFDPETAEWLLKTDSTYVLPSPSGCLMRICVADGDPYEVWSTEYVEPAAVSAVSTEESLSYKPTWGEACPDDGTILICDDNGEVVEVDPQAANEMVKGDGAVEPTEGDCPAPEPTPQPEPTPKEEPTPPPAKQEEGEVLGESQTRQQLAQTGAESTHLAFAGFVLIFGGLGLVGTSRLRRQTS
ncbi:MAG: hypothetical protein ACR2PK_19510 [Acidimicrobiales bacterium]